MKTRVRFGIKGASWFFPNAAVFVFYAPPHVYAQLKSATDQVREYLTMSGRDDIAQRVVCEGTPV